MELANSRGKLGKQEKKLEKDGKFEAITDRMSMAGMVSKWYDEEMNKGIAFNLGVGEKMGEIERVLFNMAEGEIGWDELGFNKETIISDQGEERAGMQLTFRNWKGKSFLGMGRKKVNIGERNELEKGEAWVELELEYQGDEVIVALQPEEIMRQVNVNW